MLFTTDVQTLQDLNIFGRRGDDSIYQLYNRTVTRGGAALLEEMFRYPLSDEEAINRRSGILQYFAGLRLARPGGQRTDFPFQAAQFDAVEMYLAMTDERTRLPTTQASLNGRLATLIGSDTEYRAIQKGVTALAEIFRGMRRFLESVSGTADAGRSGGMAAAGGTGSGDGSSAYAAEAAEITALLDAPHFLPLQEPPPKGNLPYEKVAQWDAMLRFRHRSAVREVLRLVYLLDIYISVARVATEKGFVYPRALPRGQHTVRLEGVYHPGLKKPVPNTLSITPGRNLVFLTGANMAGKSTFMKSLGIALFLAHMGFPVAAAKMEFSVRDGLFTTINLPDNLGMGASHFYAEVLRVKKMAVELSQGKNLFIIFDELFRGTNVKDAYEATVAITSAFARKRNSMFVISTHIIEAGEELKTFDNIRFVYLPTRMQGHIPVYTYMLENGITADRHGMIIIQNEGILDILRKAPQPGVKIPQS